MAITVDSKPDLPDIFPVDNVTVDREEHQYQTNTDSQGNTLEILEYTLDKAPIQYIVKVTGTLDGTSGHEFVKGTDYELSNDNNRIVWQSNGDRPDPGTAFYVTYVADSIIGRYIDAGVAEMDTAENKMQTAIDTKFVDRASGQNLDYIGSLFGRLGARDNRNDAEYRAYLKTIVQSFVSVGTIDDVKTAVAAASSGIDKQDVAIDEDFDNNSYEITISNISSSFVSSAINDAAEIADPSGVALSGPPIIILDGAIAYIDISSATVVSSDTDNLGSSANTLGNFKLD